jgi:type I restriction enzyme S subunit
VSWPTCTLEHLVKVSKGKKHNLSNAKTSVRYLQIDDLRNDDLIKYTDDRQGTFVNPDDLIIAWDGANAGTIGYGLEGLIGSTLARLHIVKDGVDTRYIGRFLQSRFQEIRSNCTGATIPHVSKSHLLDIDVPLPPLAEQKRIAAILDKADAIRRKRQQAIQLADDFLRAVFLEMFGDPVTNPKGWEVKPLKQLAKVTTGNTPSRMEAKYYGDHIEWIKSDNINTPSHFLTEATEYLSEDGAHVGRSVSKGATLVTCIAGSFECIGNAAYADRDVAFNQQINALTPLESTKSWFLYSLILFSKKHIQSASTNSMKGMVSKGKMEEIPMICPPISVQERYESIFLRYLDMNNKMNSSAQCSVNEFMSLTQRAFSGQL